LIGAVSSAATPDEAGVIGEPLRRERAFRPRQPARNRAFAASHLVLLGILADVVRRLIVVGDDAEKATEARCGARRGARYGACSTTGVEAQGRESRRTSCYVAA
jgi:hypothetical protein